MKVNLSNNHGGELNDELGLSLRQLFTARSESLQVIELGLDQFSDRTDEVSFFVNFFGGVRRLTNLIGFSLTTEFLVIGNDNPLI